MPTLALAGQLVSRAPDITRLLDKLDQRGLLARERPAENRRVVLVGISRKGSALLDNLSAHSAAALYQRFSSRGESTYADKLLSAMRQQFGGHVELPAAK